MFTIWIVFHILVCLALILVVLLQSSKGEGLAGSAFGGGGGLSGAVFGGRGAASFLSRATTALAIVFMLNCGGLAFMSASNISTTTTETQAESVVTREAQKERDQALQLQQERQQQQADSALDNIQILPNEAAGTTQDTSGN